MGVERKVIKNMFNGGMIGVVDIPKGDIKSGFREASMGIGDDG